MNRPFKPFVLLVLMLVAAAVAAAMRPDRLLADERPTIELDVMVPKSFGEWRDPGEIALQIVNPEQSALLKTIYTQTLSRSYVNAQGYRIMLSIAYGRDQSDNLQLHKPEICYPAQGFTLDNQQGTNLLLGNRSVPSTRLLTHLGKRVEPVTYWTVVGDHITTSGVNKKLTEMRYGLQGVMPDGMLVRVSSIDRDTEQAYRLQAEFATALVDAIAPEHRSRFSGLALTPGQHTVSNP